LKLIVTLIWVLFIYYGSFWPRVIISLLEVYAFYLFIKVVPTGRRALRKIVLLVRWVICCVFFRKPLDKPYLYVDLQTKKSVRKVIETPRPSEKHLRMVCVSDTHLIHEFIALPPGDVLIITGDILFKDVIGTIEDGIKDLENFNSWLATQPFKYKIVLAGNHDETIKLLGSEKTSQILSNAVYLENKMFNIEGVSIYGSPISPTGKSRNKAFQVSKERLHDELSTIPSPLDVLLTHGCNSEIQNYVDSHTKSRVHIFGHYHREFGVTFGENSTFLNAAIVNQFNLPTHSPILFDLLKNK